MSPRFLRKNKVLCTIGAGPHEELLALARPGFVRYARRHGYSLVLETRLLDEARPASWSKVLLVERLMARFRHVVWMDCDTFIVDSSKDILDELPRRASLGLVAHRTPEGDHIPNMGVFAVRADRHARWFFAELWKRTEFIQHKWWENAAALALMGYSTEAPVRLLSPKPFLRRVQFIHAGWNSLSVSPAEDARIIHFAGLPHDVRIAEMSRLARELGS